MKDNFVRTTGGLLELYPIVITRKDLYEVAKFAARLQGKPKPKLSDIPDFKPRVVPTQRKPQDLQAETPLAFREDFRK